jgi:hypothetical protein
MRILIIDDDGIKREFMYELCDRLSPLPMSNFYAFANNYQSAVLFKKEFFDIVIIDYNLKSTKTGLDFYKEYSPIWPGSKCFLYSAFADEVNRNEVKTINCLSSKELEKELSIALQTQEATRMQAATLRLHQQDTPASIYNEKFCDERHAKDKEEHTQIKATQEKYEAVNEKEHGVIKESLDGFKNEIKGHNNKIFWVVVTGVGAQVLTFITIVSFILTVISKIKITG